MAATVAPTARALGIEVHVDEAFAESGSGGWVDDDAFARAVAAFLDRPDEPPAAGWEDAASVIGRFVPALERLLGGADGPVVVCSGGRAITTVLCHLGIVERERSFEAWRGLGSPDVIALDRRPVAGALRWVRASG